MRILLWIVGILIVAGLGFYAYMGGFHSVKIEQGTFGPIEFAYATHKGPYSDLSTSWTKFMTAWNEAKLKTCLTMGVYLDKPDTPPEKLRSLIGCRIDGWTEEDKAAARAKFPTAALPQGQALMSVFPFRNFLSFFLAPTRVYPEIARRMAEDKTEAVIGIELYGSFDDITDIRFVMPLGADRTPYQPLFDAFAEK
jgi:hypothetical protein